MYEYQISHMFDVGTSKMMRIDTEDGSMIHYTKLKDRTRYRLVPDQKASLHA